MHGSHHKTGTKWTEDVLRAVSKEFGWTFQLCRQKDLHWSTDVFMETHSAFDLSMFNHFRGSHIIRDPRDVVISGYHYHLRASEDWLRHPRQEYSGRSYQQFLKSVDYYDGMAEEMRWAKGRTIRDMLAWDYDDDRFFEMKYEHAVRNPTVVFEKLFEHYGMAPNEISRGVELALEHRLAATPESGRSGHVRDGRPEQWRNVYDERLRAAYEAILGHVHTRLGYEDW